jgi:hypothetical protein
MLKNEPLRAQRTAKKILRYPLSTKPQTFGALGGLGGSSLSLKLEFQQPSSAASSEGVPEGVLWTFGQKVILCFDTEDTVRSEHLEVAEKGIQKGPTSG